MSVIVSNLTKRYGSQLAIDSLNFQVNEGEIVGFLGPNGAGKTTTMKIITGFIPGSDGTVTVYDNDVTTKPEHTKALIGYLPEHNPLYLDMYVREYLRLVAKIHKIKQVNQEVERVIETTGLAIESHKKIKELSKGYRQRVGLAQAIIHNPKVLILDEPTSGLDPNQLADIRSLIKKLSKEKIVIFSSHIMQEVEALCTRVIILNKGVIVADDPIGRLTSRVTSSQVVNVEFEKAIETIQLESLGNIEVTHIENNRTWSIVNNESDDLRKRLFDLAVQANNRILMLSEDKLDIQGVFESLTKIQTGND